MSSKRTTARDSAHYAQRRHLERAGDHLLEACVELGGFVRATVVFADFEHSGPATAGALAQRHRSVKRRLEVIKREFQAVLTEQSGYEAEWEAHVAGIDREPVAHLVSADDRVATALARQFEHADGDRAALDRLGEVLDRFGLEPDGPDWAEWHLEVRCGRLYWAPAAPPAPETAPAEPEPAEHADPDEAEGVWPVVDDTRAPQEESASTAGPPDAAAVRPRVVFDPSLVRSVPVIADEDAVDRLYDFAEAGSGAELTAHAQRLGIGPPDARHRWALGWSRPENGDGDRRLVWYDPDKLAAIHAAVQRAAADHPDFEAITVSAGPAWDDWYLTFTETERGEDATTGAPSAGAVTAPGPAPATGPTRAAATPGPAAMRPHGDEAGPRPASTTSTAGSEA